MTRGVLISGMFRSGTTLASRMLSASPEALVVADPFVYFFKAYRNFHLERSGATGWHPDQPTSDHFHSPTADADRAILDGDLSELMDRSGLERLRADIREWKSAQHPRLCDRLDALRPGTFAEIYRQLIDLCVELYGSEATTLAGTKVSWSEEYLPALARAFPDMRFVLLVRDLRAIAASQNAKQGEGAGKRPLLFYVRHWRKSVAFTRAFLRADSELAGRVKMLRYEDIVRDTAASMEALYEFLNMNPTAGAWGEKAFPALDGEGDWQPNSSFDATGPGVYTSSLERWKKALSEVEIGALTSLAAPELLQMGYDVPAEIEDPLFYLRSGCEPRFDELATWLQPFVCAAYLENPHAEIHEYALESLRRSALEGEALSTKDARTGFFLDEATWRGLSAAWQGRDLSTRAA